jgi:hypothetical protein
LRGQQPSDEVFWLLGQVVDASEVRFSEWQLDPSSEFESRTGKAFLVTDDRAIFARYSNVLTEEPAAGSTSIAIQRLSDIRSLSWDKDHSISGDRLDPGAIKVTAEDWAVDLPYSKLYAGGHEYLRSVRTALKF